MQSRDFCFWLQGFFELTQAPNGLTAEQSELIKVHLDLVFKHDAQIKTKEMEHALPKPRALPIQPFDGQALMSRPMLDGVTMTC